MRNGCACITCMECVNMVIASVTFFRPQDLSTPLTSQLCSLQSQNCSSHRSTQLLLHIITAIPVFLEGQQRQARKGGDNISKDQATARLQTTTRQVEHLQSFAPLQTLRKCLQTFIADLVRSQAHKLERAGIVQKDRTDV